MNHNVIVKNYLSSILSLIDELRESDLEKLECGDFEIELKIVRKSRSKVESVKNEVLSSDYFDLLIKDLDLAKSREGGIDIIEKYLKSKNELVLFAKHIDVAFSKSDKVSKIKDTIVDATVGAKLRSNAIQGKEM